MHKLAVVFSFVLSGMLSASLAAEPLCPAVPEPPPDVGPEMQLEARQAQAKLDQSMELTGDVTLSHGRRRIYVEKVFLDKESSEAHLLSPFRYEDPLLQLTGQEGVVDIQQRKGSFVGVNYLIRANGGHGQATNIRYDSEEESELSDITYSTCPEDNPVWTLSASSLHLQHDRGQGIAKNALLRIYRVPVLYAPVFPFPLGTRRQSGFLAPKMRAASYTGFDLSVPYYFNIAPDRDATLLVRGMAKQGLALGGEYRYLADRGDGELYAEINPEASGAEQDRGYIKARVQHRSSWWTAKADIEHVSDRDYFEDYGGHSRRKAFLSQQVGLYRRFSNAQTGVQVVFGVNKYQVIQSGLSAAQEPYEQLPFVRLNYRHVFDSPGTDLSLRTQWARFRRDAGTQGWRLHARSDLGSVWRHHRFWLRPRLSADALVYNLDEGEDSPPGRLVPAFTMDSGVLLDGGRSFFDEVWHYSLTPSFRYRYVPYRNQNKSPLFDTSEHALTASSLFYDNRYTGPDRIGDEHSVTLALETELWRWSSNETARFTIGRKMYLRDRRLILPEDLSATARQSPLFQQFTTHFGNWHILGHWRLGGGRKHDDYAIRVRHQPDSGRYWELSHNNILTDTRSTRTLLRYNIAWTQRLRLHGHIDYIWTTSSLYDMVAGLDVRFCCWSMTVGARRRGRENDNYMNELFMQINLSGLAPEKK